MTWLGVMPGAMVWQNSARLRRSSKARVGINVGALVVVLLSELFMVKLMWLLGERMRRVTRRVVHLMIVFWHGPARFKHGGIEGMIILLLQLTINRLLQVIVGMVLIVRMVHLVQSSL